MEWAYIYGGIAVFCGGIATGLAIYRKCVIDDLEILNQTKQFKTDLTNIVSQLHNIHCTATQTRGALTEVRNRTAVIYELVDILRLSK